MKKTFIYILAISVGLIFFTSGCTSLKVTATQDDSVDFTKYKTLEFYGWAKESDKLLTNADKAFIENAFAAEFAKRGIKLVKEGGDIVATLFVVIQEKSQTSTQTDYVGGYYGGYYGYGPGWGWGPTYVSTRTVNYNYKEGTLVCDVFDKNAESLIWEGVASKTLESSHSGREDRIARIVNIMMKKFPIEPVEKK